MIIPINDLPPALAKIAKRGSRKRKAIVSIYHSIDIDGGQWSGGSRSVWSAWNIVGDDIEPSQLQPYEPKSWPHNMGIVSTQSIADFEVIVDCGTFCGKPATPKLYVNPETWKALNNAV